MTKGDLQAWMGVVTWGFMAVSLIVGVLLSTARPHDEIGRGGLDVHDADVHDSADDRAAEIEQMAEALAARRLAPGGARARSEPPRW